MSDKKKGREVMQPAHVFKNIPLVGQPGPAQVEKIFGTKAPAFDDAIAAENAELKDLVADLEAKIDKLESDLAKGNKKELLSKIAELEAQIAEITAAGENVKPEAGDGAGPKE